MTLIEKMKKVGYEFVNMCPIDENETIYIFESVRDKISFRHNLKNDTVSDYLKLS